MTQYSGRAALWVMGALDELQAIGLVDIGGDCPLESKDQRYDYRLLKHQGYVPDKEEVRAVLNSCVAEQNFPGFFTLFEAIIDHGWDRVKQERAIAKADEVDDAPDGFCRDGDSDDHDDEHDLCSSHRYDAHSGCRNLCGVLQCVGLSEQERPDRPGRDLREWDDRSAQ